MPVHRRYAGLGMTLLVTLLGAGCHGNSSGANSPNSSATTSPPGLTQATSGCPSRDIPGGFQLDAARSGVMAASQYSESGDMQAAMIYDGYQTGFRSVYTNLGPAPGGDTDLVIECDTLQFQAPSGVTQFLAAYKALRDEAGSLAQSQTPVASVGTTTLQYLETGQSFAGYNIASTDVLELATQAGADFFTVAVAGPSPPPTRRSRCFGTWWSSHEEPPRAAGGRPDRLGPPLATGGGVVLGRSQLVGGIGGSLRPDLVADFDDHARGDRSRDGDRRPGPAFAGG